MSADPSFPGPQDNEAETTRDLAARWIVRQDRRLTPAETVELEAWLAADARHRTAFEQARASWSKFRELGQAVRRAPAVSPTTPARSPWRIAGGLAAAAAIVALAFVGLQRITPSPAMAVPAEETRTSSRTVTRKLPDGSVAQLKEGAEITESFTPGERRVRQIKGEVYFTVEKDAARPFYVEVGDVTVRAVGTAFAVRFDARAVDVLVTEGKVQVTPPPAKELTPVTADERESGASSSSPVSPTLVGAGHRAVVARQPRPQGAAVVVRPVSAAEIARSLTWSDAMLDLGGSSLAELAAAFEQRTGKRLEIADAGLGAVKIGGRFPPDDLDGFVRALEEIYEVKAERRTDGSIRLSRAK